MLGLVLGWGIFQPLRNSIFLGDVSAFLWCDLMVGRDIPQQWLGSSSVSEPLCMTWELNSGLRIDDDELSSLYGCFIAAVVGLRRVWLDSVS